MHECFIYQRKPEVPFNQRASLVQAGQKLGCRNSICLLRQRHLMEMSRGGSLGAGLSHLDSASSFDPHCQMTSGKPLNFSALLIVT